MDWIRGPFPGWNIAFIWTIILFFIVAHLLRLGREERTAPKIVETTLFYILGIGGFALL